LGCKVNKETFISKVLPLQNSWFKLALGYLKNEFAAKDLVQDVAIKVWEKRADWEQVENFPAWCMRIARNRCLDILKKEKRIILSISANNYDTTDADPNPQEELELQDGSQRIRKLIDRLEEPQRTIMTLREMECNSYKEIADLMNMSLEQVKVNIYRGRQKLKNIIINKNNHES